MQQCEQLRKYNRWRRGDKRLKMPDPKELGELIDGVADRLEVLEREHAEFFDRWHEHRRAIEAIVRVLGPSAPTCDGCAVEIAEALKIARKLGSGETAVQGDMLLPANDRVEGRDAASSRRVPSHDGLCGNGNYNERTDK